MPIVQVGRADCAVGVSDIPSAALGITGLERHAAATSKAGAGEQPDRAALPRYSEYTKACENCICGGAAMAH